jgi:Ubiquitin-2 like Rad60 SUMO-like
MRANNIRFTTVDVRPSPVPGADMVSEDGDSGSDSDDVRSMSQGPQGASDTFKLTLRSARVPGDVVVTVRPSTKCGAIVKAYLKKAGLGDKYLEEDRGTTGRKRGRKSLKVVTAGPSLMVDGDKMNNDAVIGDAELEDGDMVEVVGL